MLAFVMRAFSLVLLFSVAVIAPMADARQSLELSNGWSFVRRDVGPAAVPDAKWETVSVPHTWNAIDGANGLVADPNVPDGYYRGAGWYVRPLTDLTFVAGQRVFARFGAVATVADVWLNDRHLGQHRGAFAAFCFELTPFLRGDGSDVLRVRADNSRFQDVAPLQGDFTVFGGVYRPVELLVTDATCISPLDHGSSGVFLTPKSLTDAEAAVEAAVELSGKAGTTAQVEVEVTDAAGTTAGKGGGEVTIAGDGTTRASVPLRIARPHRWQGRKDPYLYTATIRLRRDGRVIDEVRQPLGLRTIELTPDRGALLNGAPYALHGVNRHQDRAGKGWALSAADHAEDVALMVELGCTSVRLAHYQQNPVVHDLCDRNGLVLWQEIPLVDRISSLPQFADNAKQQLTEMILQGYNHPSLCFWGVFNELEATWAEQPGPRPDALIAELRDLAHRLDSSRPTVAASWKRDPDPLHAMPDGIAFNVYPGWYWGKPDDFGPLVESLSAQLNGRRVGISEYGAGASVVQHQEGELAPPTNTATRFHPEEWQASFHERVWALAQNNPRLWGTWIWNLCDFAVDKRDEGDTPGRNDKGLVTYDRKIRKDAFYFYKANWSDEPVVYLAARRLTPRKRATTEVKAYSNCGPVELFVNGRSLGVQAPDAVRIARWPGVTLVPGENRVALVGRRDGKDIRDECVWVLDGTAP